MKSERRENVQSLSTNPSYFKPSTCALQSLERKPYIWLNLNMSVALKGLVILILTRSSDDEKERGEQDGTMLESDTEQPRLNACRDNAGLS